MKLKLPFKNLPVGLALVIALSILPLFDLFHSGLPITHDGIDHVARIANFYKSLSEGILFPRWAANLNWGYGHPILMFLYPFSSYAASLFHLVGFSFVDSLKIIFGIGFIASAVTMYMWAREQLNEYCGIAAALLYIYAPYRFVDLYVRGAIGEHMAFIFPPLTLFFLLRFFKSKNVSKEYWYLVGISVSFTLLLLAHNAISLMFVPVLAFYSLFLSYQNKQFRKLCFIFLAFVWGLLISGFFTFPAFFEGKFTLRDIVTGNEYKDRFVNPLAFLYGPWSYGITGQFSVQIGIANIIGVLLLPFVVLKQQKKKNITVFIVGMFILFLISIFLQLSQSDFLYNIVTTLKKFQFPWRFLSLTVFTTSIIGSAIFLVVKQEIHKRIIMSCLIVILLSTTFTYWKAKTYTVISDSFFTKIYHGTTDTGESSPIWSIRFMEKEPRAHMDTIDGVATISEISRTSVKHSYNVLVTSETARFRENTLYFPNWTLYVDGVKQETQFQDPNERGLITFNISNGKHNVLIAFQDTKFRIISNTLSVFSILLVPIFTLIIWLRKKK